LLDKRKEEELLKWGNKEVIRDDSPAHALNRIEAGLAEQKVSQDDRNRILAQVEKHRKHEDAKKASLKANPKTAQKNSSFWIYILAFIIIAATVYLFYSGVLSLSSFNIKNFRQ